MEIDQHYLTPDQVPGIFTIRRVANVPEDNYCYLTVDLHDEEEVIVYNYPPEDAALIRQFQVPCRAVFEDGKLRVGGVTHN